MVQYKQYAHYVLSDRIITGHCCETWSRSKYGGGHAKNIFIK